MKINSDYKLSKSTVEKLEYYVYLLINTDSGKPFYVGKGKGNRINRHFLDTLDKNVKQTEKIKNIRKLGIKVKKVILRHGLTERESFILEAAIIDYIGLENLANLVGGHTEGKGLMDLKDLKIKYEAKEAIFDRPVLLININNQFKKDMSEKEIYDATRKYWKVNINKAREFNIICAVSQGIIREVFELSKWTKATREDQKGRSFFTGHIASDKIRNKYINKSVVKFWLPGAQNPIKYSK